VRCLLLAIARKQGKPPAEFAIKKAEASSNDSKHALILAENDPGYSTVTDFARLRG